MSGPDLDRLSAADSSVRLQAALAVGTAAEPEALEVLVARCAVDEDFFVRDMLTWALTRLPAAVVVPRLLAELASPLPQARSQALHTLSKVGDPATWPAVSGALLHDPHDEVARSAWRAAVALVPDGAAPGLAVELLRELGRGDDDLQRSLSRALVALGEDVLRPLLADAESTGTPDARIHAVATGRLLDDPDAAFGPALEAAQRAAALGPGPIPGAAG